MQKRLRQKERLHYCFHYSSEIKKRERETLAEGEDEASAAQVLHSVHPAFYTLPTETHSCPCLSTRAEEMRGIKKTYRAAEKLLRLIIS